MEEIKSKCKCQKIGSYRRVLVGLAHSLDCITAPLLSSSSNRRVNITATKADKEHVSGVTRRTGEDVERRHAWSLAVTKSPWLSSVCNPAHKLSTFEQRGRDLRRTPRDGAGKAKLGELFFLVLGDWRGL
jgi:hypothetical protein